MCLRQPLTLSCLAVGILASACLAQSDPVGVAAKSDPAQNSAEAELAQDAVGDPFGLNPKPAVAKVTLSATSPETMETQPSGSLPAVSIAGAGRAREEKIRAALQTSVVVEFNEAPLSDVVNYLKDATKIPIIIDRKALDDVGLRSDTPVTISMRDISLRALLRIMLGELGLTYAVRDDVLKITTPEESENGLATRLYPVADLAQIDRLPMVTTRPVSRHQLLCDLIQAHVIPDSWHHVGGAGTIMADDAWGFLAISQTDEAHEKVEALLATLRRAREVVPGSPQEQESLTVLDEAESAARAPIEEALQREAEFDFIEAPLCEVVEMITSTYGIPVFLNKRALDDVGLGGDTPVTVSLQGIPLCSALPILLKDLDLTLLLRHEVLEITTPEEAENHPTHSVFLVRDFATPPGNLSGGTVHSGHVESLAQMVQRTIAPDTWHAVGGAGRIDAVEPWGLLIVTQSDDVLQQIGGLLSAARSVRSFDTPSAESPGGTPPGGIPGLVPPELPSPFGVMPGGRPEQGMVLKPYVLNVGLSVQEMTDLIRGTIPGRWTQQSPGAGIFPMGNTLLIFQTPAAHAQIEQLLRDIRAVPLDATGLSGGFF